MKAFLFFIALLVIAALAAPFFMTVKGKPVMTLDDVVADSTPHALKTTTEIYRWQDEHGVWQFGEEPPAQGAEQVQIEEKITALENDWHGNQRPQRAPVARTPVPGIGGLLQGKELIDEAKTQVGNLNDRHDRLTSTLKDASGRQ